jgi:hypothetical protein
MCKQTIHVGEKNEGLRVVAVETHKSAKSIVTDLYFVRQQVSDFGGKNHIPLAVSVYGSRVTAVQQSIRRRVGSSRACPIAEDDTR